MAIKLVDKIKILATSDWESVSILLSQLHSGLLVDEGWFHSYKLKKAVDKNLKPIPWTTYSFIDFIKPRLNNTHSVFEFGAGNSSYFFSERVKSVVSVEHNETWFNELRRALPPNVQIILKTDKTSYSNYISESNKTHDIILVDGIERIECIHNSLTALTERGVIVLDDSERSDYISGIKEIKERGFRDLEFWGIAPGILFKKCTTIFYRQNNCLGI